MKQQQKSVADYLNEYESNAQYSNFSDNNLDQSSDAYFGAAGDAGRSTEGVPYIIQMQNTLVTTLNALLFGYNQYQDATNYGSDIGIVVTAGVPRSVSGYTQLLNQSATSPFEIGLWRFSCSNTSQLDQSMLVTYKNANSRLCQDPVDLSSWKDMYALNQTIVERSFPVKIDGNTQVLIPILAGATLTLSLYPRSIADVARPLVGGQQVNQYTTPRLSGRNAPIIQVTGAVQPKVLNG